MIILSIFRTRRLITFNLHIEFHYCSRAKKKNCTLHGKIYILIPIPYPADI